MQLSKSRGVACGFGRYYAVLPYIKYNLKWLLNGSDGSRRRVGIHTENEAEGFPPQSGGIANDYIIYNGFQYTIETPQMSRQSEHGFRNVASDYGKFTD